MAEIASFVEDIVDEWGLRIENMIIKDISLNNDL